MKTQTGAYYFQTLSQLSVSGSPCACIAAGLEKLGPENAIPPPHALSSNHWFLGMVFTGVFPLKLLKHNRLHKWTSQVTGCIWPRGRSQWNSTILCELGSWVLLARVICFFSGMFLCLLYFLLEHIGQKEKKCHFFLWLLLLVLLFYLSVPTLTSKLLQSRNLVIWTYLMVGTQ